MFKNIHEILYSTDVNVNGFPLPNFFEEIFNELKSELKQRESIDNTKYDINVGEIIFIEALYITYMDIFGIEQINHYLDPLALTSKYLESSYSKETQEENNINNQNKKVLMYWKLFSHINEDTIKSAIGTYDKASRIVKMNNLSLYITRCEERKSLVVNKVKSDSSSISKKEEIYLELINNHNLDVTINNKVATLENKKVKSKPKDRDSFLSIKEMDNISKVSKLDKKTDKLEVKNKLIINHHNYTHANDDYTPSKINAAAKEKAIKEHEENFKDRLINNILSTAINDKSTKEKRISNPIGDISIYRNVSKTHEEVFKKILLYKCDKEGNLTLLDKDKPQDTSFKLGDTFYLVGPTGSGKSITTEAAIVYYMMQGLRVVYVCQNISQSIELFYKVNKLIKQENLNLNAPTILTGKSKEEHKYSYMYNKLNSVNNNLNDIMSIYTDDLEQELLEQLDTTCLLKAPLDITPKMNISTGSFCDKLQFTSTKDFKHKSCPLYTQCGYYKRFVKMKNSNLWIVNTDALFHSSFSETFDKYQRTFLETALTWADIVIKDEADALQAKEESLAFCKKELSHRFTRNSDEIHGTSVLDAVKTSLDLIDKANNQRTVVLLKERIKIASSIDEYLYVRLNDLGEKHLAFMEDTFSLEKLFGKMFNSCINILSSDTTNENESQLNTSDKETLDKEKTKEHKDSINLIKAIFKNQLHALTTKKEFNDYLERTSKIKFILQEEQQKEMNDYAVNLIGKITEQVNHVLAERYKLKVKLTFKDDDESLAYFDFYRGLYLLDKITTKEIEPNIPNLLFVLIEEGSSKNNTLDKLIHINNRMRKHQQYMPAPIVNINGYRIVRDEYCSKSKKVSKSNFKILKSSYEGKSSEIIHNANQFFAAQYNIRPATIFYTSATSEAEGSSLYNINNATVDYLIRHEDQKNQKIDVFLNVFLKDPTTPIFVSGSGNIEKNLAILIEKMSEKDGFLEKINKEQELLEKDNGEATPITLIVTNSYPQAKIVGQTLTTGDSFKREDVAVLVPKNESLSLGTPYLGTKLEDLETLYSKNVRVLVAPAIIIKRALNILRSSTSHKSLIYDVVFPIRPYPTPDDALSMISLVYEEEIRNRKNDISAELEGYKSFDNLIQKCSKKLDLLLSGCKWGDLSYDDKMAIATNVLVDIIIQTIGRGRRGGTDVRVHFCDYATVRGAELLKLVLNKKLDINPNSMLYFWELFLNKKKELHQQLYKEVREGFNNISIDIYR